MILQLSEEPRRLVSTFLAYRNDIDIYTEDELKDKEFYRVLFRKLVRTDIRINDITPLGSRSNVISRCQTEPDNGRKKIFIIDADIGIVLDEAAPAFDNLFMLNAYCVENLIFEKSAIIEYIYFECGVKSREEIENELAVECWLDSYVEPLVALFLHFALLRKQGKEFKLDNANRYHEKGPEGYLFSKDLVLEEVERLKRNICEGIGQEEYDKEIGFLKHRWEDGISSLLTVVSGKDYLIPLLLIKGQQFKKSKALPTLEEVKLRLVTYSNLHNCVALKTAIEAQCVN